MKQEDDIHEVEKDEEQVEAEYVFALWAKGQASKYRAELAALRKENETLKAHNAELQSLNRYKAL